MSIKLIIVDDHKIMRDGLRCLLENTPGMEVIAEAAEGRTAVQLVRELSPDVVIMDVAMPDLNGIEATRKIREESPDTKVVALSMHSDKRFVAEMLNAGASGYLLKDCAFEELACAVNTIISDKYYLSSNIAGVVMAEYVQSPHEKNISVFSVLTAREREVLQLLAEGGNTTRIAATLHVSEKTVDAHRRNIMSKLDIQSMAGLIKYAIREGLTFI
ncbi:response regulator transcription factor [Pelotomaculum sp. PtaB.Bin117]|uniref:response regulator n=1 Tax=Pelotomaculum sp. PtaB.Bin117 TaxID=1811694 RepID=UPI0009D3B9A4|nr:response regulator transcription factor [Pelotomaculum sp. PtaB.Bin117]OPX91181.1 MAG: Response regulator UvrY [Pelotomaculum sp. PtaB.Bin117]OPY60418.1 MAG: Response regulator UvrY [Pelotomaculum sp. PtaU1.Bin065]